MATRVPKPKIVSFIIKTLKESGGRAKGIHLIDAYKTEYGGSIRCLATFISDCRKLGAEIEYNKSTDTLTLISEPTRTVPLQRNIENVVAAVHHAEEWLGRSRRGMIETNAVRILVREVKKYRDIPPRNPTEPDPFLKELESFRFLDAS